MPAHLFTTLVVPLHTSACLPRLVFQRSLSSLVLLKLAPCCLLRTHLVLLPLCLSVLKRTLLTSFLVEAMLLRLLLAHPAFRFFAYTLLVLDSGTALRGICDSFARELLSPHLSAPHRLIATGDRIAVGYLLDRLSPATARHRPRREIGRRAGATLRILWWLSMWLLLARRRLAIFCCGPGVSSSGGVAEHGCLSRVV